MPKEYLKAHGILCNMNTITVVFFAHGHKNVLATHKTTFEVTKEETLSKQGDCILAVKSTKTAIDLPVEFKKAAKKDDAQITITIEVDELKETVKAKGNPKLQFTHPTDLVVRKSDYTCERTLAIRADKAAVDFSRKLVEKLTDPNQTAKITLTVEHY
ncbi:MAG: DUF371 domain-containing protein [Candidatus Bathyarchaeota archaeon]|nr:DUF371 domain-containing protein [Candidatus Bathyarchaeum sp.]